MWRFLGAKPHPESCLRGASGVDSPRPRSGRTESSGLVLVFAPGTRCGRDLLLAQLSGMVRHIQTSVLTLKKKNPPSV